MANGLNNVFLLGNLGGDPELKHAGDGTPFLKLRLATTEAYRVKDSEDWSEKTHWHNVSIWGRRCEPLSKLLSKGQRIMVSGALRTNEYDDDKGQRKYFTEVRARDIYLTGLKRDRGESGNRDMPDEIGLQQAPTTARGLAKAAPPEQVAATA